MTRTTTRYDDDEKFIRRFAKFAVAIWAVGFLLSVSLIAAIIWAIVKVVGAVTA